ncbi:PD40 domain-containing protein [Pseudochryseolinea flava]|uniref:WD40-like Beta Propeller Repeat n=1 Tax=Pseudochryseolinea flava TaxID=2059302 RepID=A0A364Y010_9BACT|nr:PD40 domain-containing protein [Pseudochryseolinea flava]RAV99984.1 hypothetical protein DQQ10_15610 [Pseudochryseolinea flava]
MSLLKSIATALAMITIALQAWQCTTDNKQRKNRYPHPTPDSVALTFLPGIVSGDSLDFNACFSPDGERFYFSRSRHGKWVIYMTEYKDTTWGKPVLAPFSDTTYSQADPFITGDGTLLFISNRPRDMRDSIADYDIWSVRLQGDGSWTTPVNVAAVNSDSTEYYVSASANGNLYFASNREGTLGSHDIYVSRYVDGIYTTPENLGPAINATVMEHDPMISPDEQYLIFTSVDRADSYGSGDLYYSRRGSDGVWTQAQNMGSRVNTNTYEYCSYLTSDGAYLFYSTNYDVKWISTKYLLTAINRN